MTRIYIFTLCLFLSFGAYANPTEKVDQIKEIYKNNGFKNNEEIQDLMFELPHTLRKKLREDLLAEKLKSRGFEESQIEDILESRKVVRDTSRDRPDDSRDVFVLQDHMHQEIDAANAAFKEHNDPKKHNDEIREIRDFYDTRIEILLSDMKKADRKEAMAKLSDIQRARYGENSGRFSLGPRIDSN